VTARPYLPEFLWYRFTNSLRAFYAGSSSAAQKPGTGKSAQLERFHHGSHWGL
jgi:hypothetical protein